MKKLTFTIALIINVISVCFLYSDGNGYLFRYKKVSLKYYPSSETVKIRNIDYQSIISKKIYYSEDRMINLSEANIESSDYFSSVTIQYPDNPYDVYINSKDTPENITAISITGNIVQGNFRENQKININFENPIELPTNTRSIEFYSKSNFNEYIISFYMEAYNRNGYLIREFTHKREMTQSSKWLFDSFNLLADSSSASINNLYLVGVSVDITGYIRGDTFTISISELISNSIAKHRDDLDTPAKRSYESMENESEVRRKWVLRHGINPIEIENAGVFTEHQPDDYGIPNGGNYYLQLNQDNLQGYKYLLIDFAEDYFLPIHNLISILVRGRGMGEELSFIIEDGRNIYYELSAGYIEFNSWKAMEIKVPTGFNTAYIQEGSSIPYVKLLGVKIGSGYDGRIGLQIDDISSIINVND